MSRRLVLYAAALATLLAAIFAPRPEETVQPSRIRTAPADPAASSAASGPRPDFTPGRRSRLAQEPGELFRVQRPPPPPRISAAPRPVKPSAPPLPYVYMGKMLENGELTVFLTRQDKPYVVHAGDVLDAQYRVDAIRPPLLELTYLPLDQKQTLNIGASK